MKHRYIKVNLLIIYIKEEAKLKLVIDNLNKVNFKKEIMLKVLDFSKLYLFYSNRKYMVLLIYLSRIDICIIVFVILSFNILSKLK